MSALRIGQKVVCQPYTLDVDVRHPGKKSQVKNQSGKIIYIHPARRYIVVAFRGGVRESFFPCDVVTWGRE